MVFNKIILRIHSFLPNKWRAVVTACEGNEQLLSLGGFTDPVQFRLPITKLVSCNIPTSCTQFDRIRNANSIICASIICKQISSAFSFDNLTKKFIELTNNIGEILLRSNESKNQIFNLFRFVKCSRE